MKKSVIVLLACLLAAAVGCSYRDVEPELPEPTVTPEEKLTYTASFWNGSELVSRQTLDKNTLPEAVVVSGGAVTYFTGWDKDYTAGDQDYYALFAPVLTLHECYLFPDADGMLRPHDPLTGAELEDALRALADDEAEKFFPEMPAEDKELSLGTFREVLGKFHFDTDFPETETADDELITRAQAAAILNSMLGRGKERVTVLARKGFADVAPGSDIYVDCMEAAAEHTEGKKSWEKVKLATDIEPGWILEEGRLKYVDENGYYASACTVNGFEFGADGCYTSGNEELDGYVTEIIAGFQSENPEAESIDLLRMCYDYVRDEPTYLRKSAYAMGATGWEVEDALEMLSTLKGNCYNYAAAFWALARGLGYDARAISGTMSRTYQPHGWVEIDFDGVTYYFDTETEMTYVIKGDTSRDMFKMPWSYAVSWSYNKKW